MEGKSDTSKEKPLVSVLMPVYNGMPFLTKAVESILRQSYANFEFIIVNDCSTDDSMNYLLSLTDIRLKIIDRNENGGVTAALIDGVNACRGKYIARLDSDDIAMPERIEKQTEFLESNPHIGLLGCSPVIMDEEDNIVHDHTIEFTDIDIRWKMFFRNPFYHSSVMFRRDLLVANNLNYVQTHAEDFDLWTRLLEVSQGYISSYPLIKYRINKKSWTYTKKDLQYEAGTLISVNQLKKFLAIDNQRIVHFIQWVRHGVVNSQDTSYFSALYVTLLRRFIKQHARQVTPPFILQCLKVLKKRAGMQFLLKWSLIPVYRGYISSRLREYVT